MNAPTSFHSDPTSFDLLAERLKTLEALRVVQQLTVFIRQGIVLFNPLSGTPQKFLPGENKDKNGSYVLELPAAALAVEITEKKFQKKWIYVLDKDLRGPFGNQLEVWQAYHNEDKVDVWEVNTKGGGHEEFNFDRERNRHQ